MLQPSFLRQKPTPRQSLVISRLLLLCLLASTGVQAASFVVIADLNGRYGAIGYHPRVTQAISAIIESKPDFVIIAGDMIAAQRKPLLAGPALDAMWAAFDAEVAQPLSKAGIPLVATAGNHDASAYADFASDREAYAKYWLGRPTPSNLLPGSQYPWHYAAGFDSTLVISLYGTAPGALPVEQTSFARAILDGYADNYDRVIVTTHLPIYPIANGRVKGTLSPASLQPIMDSQHVDWYISGHHHAFYPGRVHGNLEGTVYLASPALGGNRRTWLNTGALSPFGFVKVAQNGTISLHSAPDFEREVPTGLPLEIGRLRLAEDLINSD
mgnify:FL=1